MPGAHPQRRQPHWLNPAALILSPIFGVDELNCHPRIAHAFDVGGLNCRVFAKEAF